VPDHVIGKFDDRYRCYPLYFYRAGHLAPLLGASAAAMVALGDDHRGLAVP
jgi:hypothetical protein